jgi:hypothetical protein
VLLGVLVWLAYLCWPPRLTSSLTRPVVAGAAAVVALLVLAPLAISNGGHRAQVIQTQSPAQELGRRCGDVTTTPAGAPVRTLLVTGLRCRRVTAFTGYREVGRSDVASSLSPVSVTTFGGQTLSGKVVGATYGDVLVVAASGRLDHRATEVVGLGLLDAAPRWRYACPDDTPLVVRFAGADAGDDIAAGRLTLKGERASVVVNCGAGAVTLAPATGRRL